MMNKIAVVFPGQGSQLPNMLKEWEQFDPYASEIVDRASDILHYNMREILTDDPDQKLHQTQYTQPAILTCSYAIWSLLNKHTNCRVDVMAGHSLGEYTALLCGGAITFEHALKLVAERGKLMQASVPEGKGGMVAIIGLDNAIIDDICADIAQSGAVIAPANYNAIGQTVVAGEIDALHPLIEAAKSAGAKLAKLLPVSVPSHCMMLADAADQLKQYLADVPMETPKLSVLSNVNAAPHQTPDTIKEQLCQQMIMPVQWVNTIQYMVADGIKHHLEIGPNKVLTGLCKRIDSNLQLSTLQTPDQLDLVCTIMTG
jgi:[acyl-carrier-protein] S-malonyltransferase